MSKKKTSISLEPATHRKLKRIAKGQRRSVSSLVNLLLDDHFLETAPSLPRVQSKAAGEAVPA